MSPSRRQVEASKRRNRERWGEKNMRSIVSEALGRKTVATPPSRRGPPTAA